MYLFHLFYSGTFKDLSCFKISKRLSNIARSNRLEIFVRLRFFLLDSKLNTSFLFRISTTLHVLVFFSLKIETLLLDRVLKQRVSLKTVI
jgi:hypothetical protein